MRQPFCTCIFWLPTKCFLVKKLVGKIKENTLDLISRLYNCIGVDRFRYANYLQSACREYAQHVERSLTDRFSFAGVR